MSAVRNGKKDYPGAFFLTGSDLPSLASYLAAKGWLKQGETIHQAQKAGEGNMNCVLRVETEQRSFILKQSRPWVEKYPDISAPWDRSLIEARFYGITSSNADVARQLPRLLAVDADERLLMLEDLGRARDFTGLYSGAFQLEAHDLQTLTQFLTALHSGFRDSSGSPQNLDMRSLNHEHIFSLPLRSGNGLALDDITPGLSSLAHELQRDDAFCREVVSLGKVYLDPLGGSCLLHGDYFPGSWLKTSRDIFVIDPEFCFYGFPEWDVGVMLAHLHLSNQSRDCRTTIVDLYAASAPLDRQLLSKFTGVEIMRRLIGVAQLPLVCSLNRKRELLEIARALVFDEAVE